MWACLTKILLSCLFVGSTWAKSSKFLQCGVIWPYGKINVICCPNVWPLLWVVYCRLRHSEVNVTQQRCEIKGKACWRYFRRRWLFRSYNSDETKSSSRGEGEKRLCDRSHESFRINWIWLYFLAELLYIRCMMKYQADISLFRCMMKYQASWHLLNVDILTRRLDVSTSS